MQKLDWKDDARVKILACLTSTKYHVLVASCVFFGFHVLSENGWLTVVLGTLGFHTANEVGNLVKDAKMGAKK